MTLFEMYYNKQQLGVKFEEYRDICNAVKMLQEVNISRRNSQIFSVQIFNEAIDNLVI